jgi:hypothetical protein
MCGFVFDVQARCGTQGIADDQPPELRAELLFVCPAWQACASAPNQSPTTGLAERFSTFLNRTPTCFSAPEVSWSSHRQVNVTLDTEKL